MSATSIFFATPFTVMLTTIGFAPGAPVASCALAKSLGTSMRLVNACFPSAVLAAKAA